MNSPAPQTTKPTTQDLLHNSNLRVKKLLLSPQEVGLMLGVSRTKIFEMISGGKLPRSFKLGGARKFRRTDIERWVQMGMPSLERFEELAGKGI